MNFGTVRGDCEKAVGNFHPGNVRSNRFHRLCTLTGRFLDKANGPFEARHGDRGLGYVKVERQIKELSRPSDAEVRCEQFNEVTVPGRNENGVVRKFNLEWLARKIGGTALAVLGQVQNVYAESACDCEMLRIV